MNENDYYSEESIAAAKLGVNRMRRVISIAINEGLLIGGKWPENFKESHYLQYAPAQGRDVTVQINGDLYRNVTRIEYGRPCGVIILKHEDGRTDFYPEEINSIEIN